MFKLNKGSTKVILIVSIVIAVLVLGSVIGIIIWKVVGDEGYEKRSKRDKEEEEEEDTTGGFRDCGVSDIFLTADFGSPLEIDFEKDDAMVCMGENIKNNCKDATVLVKADDFDMTYKSSGISRSDCKIRLEIYDDGELLYVECPVSGLISLSNTDQYYGEFKEKLTAGNGDFAAALFLMTMRVPDADWGMAQQIVGCTGEF